MDEWLVDNLVARQGVAADHWVCVIMQGSQTYKGLGTRGLCPVGLTCYGASYHCVVSYAHVPRCTIDESGGLYNTLKQASCKTKSSLAGDHIPRDSPSPRTPPCLGISRPPFPTFTVHAQCVLPRKPSHPTQVPTLPTRPPCPINQSPTSNSGPNPGG